MVPSELVGRFFWVLADVIGAGRLVLLTP